MTIIFACNSNAKKDEIVFSEYYPGGNLWKQGKMNKDSILIDTLKLFWENKKIQEIRVYDSIGILNGYSFLFDSNGNKEYMVYFKAGSPTGYTYEYYPNGSLKTKAYHWGEQVGNTYHYDLSGNVDTFSFFGLDKSSLIEKHYSGKKLIRQRYESYFIDSILPSSDREYMNIAILSAKPPFESVELFIYKLDSSGKSYDSTMFKNRDEVDSVKIKLDPSLWQVKLYCKRVDSLYNESTIQYGYIKIKE
jgi:antitoxin component YwqK of YwqJK toxin-antitoxin module